MSIFSNISSLFENSQCPLCGGSSTYSVSGLINYATLMEDLRTREPWLKAHGLSGGIPQFLSEHAVQIRMPGFTPPAKEDLQADKNKHRRCKTCHTLLPPEFRSAGVGNRGFAITVAGFAGTGKTTWLLNMLNPADDDSYEIVRRSQRLQTRSYEYAEPATLAVLRDGARTVIPYFLFGTTIQYDNNLIFVRTLDVMGERFLGEYIPETKAMLTRHLSKRGDGGALLILDKFMSRASPPASTQPPQKLENIARVYEEFSLATSVWRGVVWTHLDQAQWNEVGGAWLKQNLPSQAEALLQLVTALHDDSVTPVNLISQLGLIDTNLVWSLAGAVMRLANMEHQSYDSYAKKKSAVLPFSNIEVSEADERVQESLIYLLLRLQMAYSLKAARHETGKHKYHEQGGRAIYAGILGLARALFVLWDSRRGNFHQLIKQDPRFGVLPCGLVGGRSIWSDLILIQAIEGSGVI